MKKMRRWIKVVFCSALALVLLVGAYVAYVFIDYHRIGDQALLPEGVAAASKLTAGESYTILSYNIGFGAYEDDYGFFMDGGQESWAWSKDRLIKNLDDIAGFLARQGTDFCLLQEVDIDSTRTYHFDERQPLIRALSEKSYVFAQNYNSPFLLYPLTQPHGASQSGLLTFSPATITDAERVELPVENGVMKLLDLDRCYSVSRIPVDRGKDLVLYNLHLSAYTSDGTIATDQLNLLLNDMQSEYELGNWCIAGGDFNKDLLGDSARYFGEADQEYTWAQPIPESVLNSYDMTLVAPLDEKDPVPSCRNADGPYHEGQYVLTVDGFLISENVTVVSSEVIDTGFCWSDHNPVSMIFMLQ